MDDKAFDLKLRVARPIKGAPDIQRGSKITALPEWKDLETIVAAVKKEGRAPQGGWKVFDLDEVYKRHPELKKAKRLMANFANQARRLMKRQSVEELISLEKRKDEYYLLGIIQKLKAQKQTRLSD